MAVSPDRYGRRYEPNQVGPDFVVECWISHGPRAEDDEFDPPTGRHRDGG
jgi:hypothetical protein